tara:strand:+ start:391 stop:582 length:192 start_codon:yes stop_codon:yes gene_type:complete
MYAIQYEPRVEDPVIIARFETKAEADLALAEIIIRKPKAGKHHKVVQDWTIPSEEEWHNPAPS